ncbi:MAG TPA: MFS transporter [Polyangiaceae bacterium]|nr:MFS transporter [Polyangiaceae bacterium]
MTTDFETAADRGSAPSVAPALASAAKTGHVRWGICALLLVATTINYVDRQVIGILKPTLVQEFGWSDERIYAAIVVGFQLAYAIGLLLGGRFIDRVGLRRGFVAAVVLWSLAAAGHAVAHRLGGFELPAVIIDPTLGFSLMTLGGAAAGFALMRFLLGLGEAANFPASIKAVAEWFPKRERAFATGLFNSGSNVGALVTPMIVPWVTLHWGWQWAFIGTGSSGLLWVGAWLAFYRPPESHPRLSPAELAFIRSDPPDAPLGKVSTSLLLRRRQTYAFALGKFLTDPVWWLYLFWIPDFLSRTYHLDLKSIGLPLISVYLMADVGSIAGGWLSSRLLARGWSVNRARKTAMLICATCAAPVVLTSQTSNLWVAVALVGLAAAAHQGWSANLFTLTSDMFPRRAVGSVVGIGGMAGAVGGILLSLVVGEVLQQTGRYDALWVMAGSAYLVTWVVIHVLAPRLEEARI